MKLKVTLISIFLLLIVSCQQNKPRPPLTVKSKTILDQTVTALKELRSLEESYILDYIKNDSTLTYHSSNYGYWYAYIGKRADSVLDLPKTSDVVTFEYEISNLNDSIIYAKEELGVREYKVDKEDFITGLQYGIKTMRIGDSIKFIIPSYNAYGVTGDGDKIAINQTIISKVTLINIKNNENNN